MVFHSMHTNEMIYFTRQLQCDTNHFWKKDVDDMCNKPHMFQIGQCQIISFFILPFFFISNWILSCTTNQSHHETIAVRFCWNDTLFSQMNAVKIELMFGKMVCPLKCSLFYFVIVPDEACTNFLQKLCFFLPCMYLSFIYTSYNRI